MATRLQVVIDCADPDRLARFWAEALGYRLQEPPEGYDSWESFLSTIGVPPERWGSASAVVDPEGIGPRIFFQRVPEAKVVKNRVHLDLNASGGRAVELDTRRGQVNAEAARLISLGATKLREQDEEGGGYFVVMQDPEGNEFCVQ